MSHFTNMKTSFQNLFYLEKALNKLNIQNHRIQQTLNNNKSIINNHNLLINQSNGHNIEFCWNGEEYELIVDISFWEQSCPVETFIDKIGQQYASEVIIGESQKMGFELIKYNKNSDGSNSLVLQRWSENKN